MYSRRLPFALALAGATLAACTPKDTEQAATTDSAAAPTATTAAGSVAPDSAGIAGANVVTVTARDFAFDAPTQVPAGLTTFRLVNQGPDLHHIQLVKLDSGKTMNDLNAALKTQGPPPRWMRAAGGPNSPRPGGGVAEATFVLEPGTYAMLCMIPGPDGVPHVAKGMVKEITVTPASGTAATPTADLTMRLVDYDFQVSGALTPGRRTIRVENAGPQPHEVFIARLAPGKTAQDLLTWVQKREGPPPAEPVGGLTVVEPGASQLITVNLAPGEYGLYCFFPDVKDGKEHVAHGMVKQIKVG